MFVSPTISTSVPDNLTVLKSLLTNIQQSHEICPISISILGSVITSEIFQLLLYQNSTSNSSNGSPHRSRINPIWIFQGCDEINQIKRGKLKRNLNSSSPPKFSLLSHHPLSSSISSSSLHKSIYNQKVIDKLNEMNILIVGTGAIGCEILKILSQMMISNNNGKLKQKGKIIIVDPDSIELSNLNRQVLFR